MLGVRRNRRSPLLIRVVLGYSHQRVEQRVDPKYEPAQFGVLDLKSKCLVAVDYGKQTVLQFRHWLSDVVANEPTGYDDQNDAERNRTDQRREQPGHAGDQGRGHRGDDDCLPRGKAIQRGHSKNRITPVHLTRRHVATAQRGLRRGQQFGAGYFRQRIAASNGPPRAMTSSPLSRTTLNINPAPLVRSLIR